MYLDKSYLAVPALIGIFALAACSSQTIRMYSGPQRASDQISILNVDRGASPGISKIAIRRVNGVDTLRNGQPMIEVLPGKQVIRVDLVKAGAAGDAYADAHSINTVAFHTKPGRYYYIRGTIEDGIGQVSVVDDQNQQIVAGNEKAGALP